MIGWLRRGMRTVGGWGDMCWGARSLIIGKIRRSLFLDFRSSQEARMWGSWRVAANG